MKVDELPTAQFSHHINGEEKIVGSWPYESYYKTSVDENGEEVTVLCIDILGEKQITARREAESGDS